MNGYVWIGCFGVDPSGKPVDVLKAWHLFEARKPDPRPICDAEVLDEKWGGPSVEIPMMSSLEIPLCRSCIVLERDMHEMTPDETKRVLGGEGGRAGAPDDWTIKRIANTKALICLQDAVNYWREFMMLQPYADRGMSNDVTEAFGRASLSIASAEQWMSGSLDKAIAERWLRALDEKEKEKAKAPAKKACPPHKFVANSRGSFEGHCARPGCKAKTTRCEECKNIPCNCTNVGG